MTIKKKDMAIKKGDMHSGFYFKLICLYKKV